MSSEKDLAILAQLPNDVERKIYSDFLFKEFYYHNRKFFSIPRQYTKNGFYNWYDPNYEQFMIETFRSLQPIRFDEQEIIY